MLKNKAPVYTEANDCQDCYKCLKECPVKAIRFEKSSASIIADHCIYCGHCVQICPVGAKKMRTDLVQLKAALKAGEQVYISLAPSYLSEFSAKEIEHLVGALLSLGIKAVSETALGAQLVSRETSAWLQEQGPGVYLSACCPAAVNYICKYHPEAKNNLIPLVSPMLAHAKLLKQWAGENIKVVFVGPCIAKKDEADQADGLISQTLTFTELKQWLDSDLPAWENNINFIHHKFYPQRASTGSFFPVEGGMISTMKSQSDLDGISFLSFSGMHHIKKITAELEHWEQEQKVFIELLVCPGGCIEGPGCISSNSSAYKKLRVLASTPKVPHSKPAEINQLPAQELYLDFDQQDVLAKTEFTLQQMKEALEAVGKFTKDDELNCGGCGYDNCRDFAQAMLQGYAERQMCITYMRQIGQGKATVLLKKMPAGVVTVDENLKIIDANRKFAELLGEQCLSMYNSCQALEGMELSRLVSFSKLFSSVLQTGEEMIEHDIHENGHYFHVSVFSIQANKMVCGLVQNMREPEVRKDIVRSYTKQVIQQNMQVVQKIAYLLGENASFTESMLNSILSSHETDEEAPI